MDNLRKNTISRFVLRVLLLALTSLPALPAEDRIPAVDSLLQGMLHKTYAECRRNLICIRDIMNSLPDSSAVNAAYAQAIGFARQHDDLHLECMVRYMEVMNPGGESSGRVSMFRTLSAECEKAGYREVNALCLFWIAQLEWRAGNYEIYYEYLRKVDGMLDGFSARDFPDIIYCRKCIAEMYYQFHDYASAIPILKKTLTYTVTDENISDAVSARNTLALCYQKTDSLDISDSYFRGIIEEPRLKADDLWRFIAANNLGKNEFLRKNYAKALPLSLEGNDALLKYGDYTYMSNQATLIARTYLKLNVPAKAEQYLELAKECFGKMDKRPHLYDWYEAMATYYIATGQQEHALAYTDSADVAVQLYYEELNAAKLLSAEQRINALQQEALNMGLVLEQERSGHYLRALLIATIAAILLSLALFFHIRLYRSKCEAYRELVRRTQSWAGLPLPENGGEEGESSYDADKQNTKCKSAADEPCNPNGALPTTNDYALWKAACTLMEKEHLYRSPELTLDTLARRMKINRLYLSQAVNRCSGSSFSVFVNEYRIKEAVRLLSGDEAKNLSLEGVAFDVGFSQRKSFYTAFKKMTGLSPSVYRGNLQK